MSGDDSKTSDKRWTATVATRKKPNCYIKCVCSLVHRRRFSFANFLFDCDFCIFTCTKNLSGYEIAEFHIQKPPQTHQMTKWMIIAVGIQLNSFRFVALRRLCVYALKMLLCFLTHLSFRTNKENHLNHVLCIQFAKKRREFIMLLKN